MNDNDEALAARQNWLTQNFGKAVATSYTDGANFTAYFPAEIYIHGKGRRLPVRGYGNTEAAATSALFDTAASIKEGEKFVTAYDQVVEPDPVIFGFAAAKPEAAAA